MEVSYGFLSSPAVTRPGKRLQQTMERSTTLSMGKSTISTGPFSIAMLNYQRVSAKLLAIVHDIINWKTHALGYTYSRKPPRLRWCPSWKSLS